MMLSAEDLHYSYPGDGQALGGVSITISPGERLALLGANGAGKSTLLLLLNGSLKPSLGRVLLDSQPATHDRKGLTRWRSRVGLVLQDPDDQLFAATVFQDVSFGPMNLGLSEDAARARVANALAAMGIADLSDRATHMLSFGQRKRAAIAGVLAMEPEVLLLDEPTAGLDPQATEDLMASLSRLCDGGTAVVIATHDMDLAYGWAERVALFGEGRIANQGPPQTIFDDADALQRLGLRQPALLRIATAMRTAGLFTADEPMPRDADGLIALLQRRAL